MSDKVEPQTSSFRAVFADSDTVKKLFRVLSSVLKLVRISAEPDGLDIEGMDEEHIQMFRLKISPSDLAEYEQSGSPAFQMKLKEFLDLFQRPGFVKPEGDEGLQLAWSSDRSKMHVVFLTGAKEVWHSVETTPSPVKMSDIAKFVKFHANVKVDSRELRKAVGAVDGEAPEVALVVDEESFKVLQSDEGTVKLDPQENQLGTTFNMENGNILELTMTEPATTTYATPPLTKASWALSQVSKTVQVEFSDRMPIRLTPQLIIFPHATLEYYLAPTVHDVF